jgi:tripartite-type tricarboxylate transporter receptor subunit TctC
MRGAIRRLTAVVIGLATGLVVWPALSSAQGQSEAWPQRNVRFIVTLGPGSGADIGARLLAERLNKRWGHPVIVENRPGGDAIIAINAFVSARDDHVLLFAPSSSFTAHQFLHDNLPYKPEDLATIVRVSNTVIALSVPADMPVKSLKELLDMARAQPGKLNWAGITGALDFLFESFLKTHGIQMSKVPYRNPVEAVNDLAQGRVQVYRSALAIAQPQLRAGRIKALAITNSTRAPAAPDLPTVTELGYPGLAVDGLVGLFGPPTMPLSLRERIAADVKEVMDADKTLTDRLTLTGQIVNPGGPVEFAKAIDEQRETIAGAAKILGVKRRQ